MRTHHVRPLLTLLGIAAVVAFVSGCAVPWLQFGGGPSHSGFNSSDRVLSLANLSGPTSFHQVWQATLPAVADGPPVITSVNTAGGWVDLAIVTTKAGDLQARNLVTGATFWTAHFPAGSCRINKGSTPCYTTSSPVVVGDFVYTYGLEVV